MSNENREAVIAELENDIELKTEEIKLKLKELNDLKIEIWNVVLSADQFGQVPRIEKKTIDDWNNTIDKIINNVNGMKC